MDDIRRMEAETQKDLEEVSAEKNLVHVTHVLLVQWWVLCTELSLPRGSGEPLRHQSVFVTLLELLSKLPPHTLPNPWFL